MMDLGDAIHLATAIIHEVDEFHTRDKDSKGVKIPLINLSEFSDNGKICNKYPLKIISPTASQGSLPV